MAAARSRASVAFFLALAGLGLAVASDLTFIHVKVHTDPTYHSFCSISSEVNCDSVAQSPYSVFLGLPVSIWGLCGYLGMALLALHRPSAERRGLGWPGLLVLLTGAALMFVAPLAAVSKLVIRSVCVMCIASWTLCAALFAAAVLEARRSGGLGKAVRADLALLGRRRGLLSAGMLAAVAVPAVLYASVPRYWKTAAAASTERLPHGTDLQGVPWIGAKDPVLTVVEFSDYQCPFCQRAERQMHALIEENAGALRVIHRQFPLDTACNPRLTRQVHPRACELALAALCAGEQGQFWPMNDAIFAAEDRVGLDLVAVAGRVGLDVPRFQECLKSPEAASHLKREIDAAIEVDVWATPTFIIGQETLRGGVFVEEIRKRLAAAK